MTTATMIIADDHDLFRDGLAQLMASSADVEVVGQAATEAQAVELVQVYQPDFLLLDVEMSGTPIKATISQIQRISPGTRVVILTMHSDQILKRELLASGAVAFITKATPKHELLEIIRSLSGMRSDGFNAPATAKERQLLSPRELEVLRRIALADSNQEIAQALSIAQGTVKRHTGNIYSKLGAKSRMDAVAKARLLGLLDR